MTNPYAIRKLNRLWQPVGGACLSLLLVSASLAQAQTLPQYSLPFNGTNQYAGVPNTAALEFTTGTVELWVKPTWTVGTHSGANLCLISERSGASVNGGTRFSLHMGNDMQSIGIWNGGSYQTVPYSFSKGQWYHVAAVMTTSNTLFYVNGAYIGTTNNGINTGRSGYNLKIGVSETEGTAVGNAEYFEGELDEVRVWNTARTATQIQNNYQAPINGTSPGLVAYYPIDNGITGTSNAVARLLKDYAASGYNGTLYNYWTEQAPTISSFSPARSAVSVPRAGNLAVTFSQNMNSATASDAAVKVFGSQTGKRTGTFTGGGTNVITFDPAQDLKPGETASMTVTTAAKSMGGLGLAQPQVVQLTGATGVASGTFSATTYPLASDSKVQRTALGDVNNDGNLDFIALTSGANTVSVLLGDGTGTLGSGATYAVTSDSYDVALSDTNGDGKLDILVGTSAGLNVLLGTGSGTFRTATTIGNNSLYSLKLADMNADGILDVVAGSGGTLYIMLGTSTGSFGAATSYSLGASNSVEIAVGDVNNDGQLDVISTNYNLQSYSVLLGSSTNPGTLGTATVVNTAADYPMRAALGDVNGDGNLDLAISFAAAYNTAVMLGTGTGSFGSPTTYSSSGSGSVILADLTGDGNLDLLTTGTGGVTVTKGVGNGTFNRSATISLSSYGGAIGDFNNDGRLDVGSVDYGSNSASVLLNQDATPTITNLSATSGMVGTSVVLTGTNFTDATKVIFNGMASSNFTVYSATQLVATVPIGATTGTIAVTTPTGTATSTQTFTVVTDLTVSNAQTIPAGTYRNITILSGGVATLGGNVVADGAVTVQAGGTLNTNCQALTGAGSFTLAAGGTLGICDLAGIAASGSTGAVQLAGIRSFSPDASYVYNGGDSQVTGSGLPSQVRSFTTTNTSTVRLSNPLSVSQVLTVANRGNFDLNGQALTLLSSSNGSALVVNSSTGIVSGGTATVQRYLDPTFNTGSGYRHYSAPVSGSTVADLTTTTGFAPVVNVSYNTSAAPGTITPFPNVFGYDQSRLSSVTSNYSAFEKGFFSPSDLTDELVVGQGYVVQIGADQLVDFTGQLNNGPKTVNLSRNADATAADAGWALVGNPYPAPLDWSQVAAADRTNLDGSIYVVQSSGPYTGSYRAYVNNVAASGSNSPLIGTGQGFFVRVSSGQTTGAITFRNSQRVTDYASQAAVYRTTADVRPLVQLELRTSTGQADGLAVYAEAGATPGYDAQYDAGKLANSTGLNLASVSATQQSLAIDGRPAFTPATVVPLTVGVPAAGTYSLAVAALHNLPAGLDAYLTDAQTGQTVRLGQQSTYAFSVTAAESVALLTGRFTLSFTAAAPLATTPAPRPIAEVALYPNPASEQFTVQVPAVAGASQVQATLLNTLGQVVRRQAAALPAAGATLTVETVGLPTGVYTLRLQAGATTTTKRVIIK